MNTISANNEILHGILELNDELNPNRLDAFKDDYLLVDLTPGKTIVINLFSEEFDPYLQLINNDTGEIIAENDDDDGLNPQLIFIPEENINYLVRVTSFSSPETGNYTLTSGNGPDVDLVIENAKATIVSDDKFYEDTYDIYNSQAYINVDLSLTVKNLGTEIALVDLDNDDNNYYSHNGWSDSVYLSSDEHFDPLEDYWLNEYWQESNLQAQESYTNKFEASIYKPNAWGLENTYLIFVADSNSNQFETNEHNNTFAIPLDLNLTPPDVDLVVTDAQAHRTYSHYGATYLDLYLTVTNHGTETALFNSQYYDDYYYGMDWYSTVYISSDEHFDPHKDSWLTEIWHYSNLEAGESYTEYSSAYLYDYDLQDLENHYLIFVADSYNYQHETNEHNNTFAIPLDLTLPDIDLVVTDAKATLAYYDEHYGEAYLDLSITVTNKGSDATINHHYGYGWSDRVYLSSDEYFDPIGDYWIADLWYNGSSLEAGESYTTEYFGAYLSAAQLNALKSGELNLLFVSNQYGGQYETDNTNNSFFTSLDSVLATPIYRYHNQDIPGTYLFVGAEESSNIHSHFPNFAEEGMAFKVGSEPQHDLIPMYRFQNKIVPGTYLYVGEEERNNINQNNPNFIEEGLSFYVYGVGSGKGSTFYRFRNTNSNLGSNYLFATGEEAEYIRHNFPDLIEEGAAFEALI
ncbi:MAG: CARDB domain-containing protein [Xenococcus sp. MO_188.B8]|nr:CARDB domain-containing protein [Xenococcus sp. MO_188.B8]